MDRRQLLQLALLAALPNVLRGAAEKHSRAPEFVLFGSRALFASHLFEFCPGRNFQILLRLRSPESGRPLTLVRNKQPLPHLQLDIQDLSLLRPQRRDRLRQLHGQWLSKPHKEYPPQFEILECLYYAQVEEAEHRDATAQYFTFGGAREWYAMHQISGGPDFEHLMQLRRGVRDYRSAELPNRREICAQAGARHRELLNREVPAAC